MGLGLIQLARARGAGLVVGVDPRPEARSRATALGADLALSPDALPSAMTSDAGRLCACTDARASARKAWPLWHGTTTDVVSIDAD